MGILNKFGNMLQDASECYYLVGARGNGKPTITFIQSMEQMKIINPENADTYEQMKQEYIRLVYGE